MSKRGSWADAIDLAVERMKWPAATLALLALPLLAWGLLRLILHVLSQPLGVMPLALGTVGFILLWRRWLDRSSIGRWLITLEHELTHALFAWATGHRIVAIRASLGRGGEVRFVGRGNWLITLAPYFFPTAALMLLVLAWFMPISILPWQGFFLGVALGFHIVSTYRETHRDQSDLKSVGGRFCWMFLPSANLAVLGLLLAWAHGGTTDVKIWFSHVREPAQALWDRWPTAAEHAKTVEGDSNDNTSDDSNIESSINSTVESWKLEPSKEKLSKPEAATKSVVPKSQTPKSESSKSESSKPESAKQ